MIAELKKALQKARHNPRHLWYFFQNVNIGRDHFPNLYRRYKLRKRLDVGLCHYCEAASAAGLEFDVIDARGHGNGPKGSLP